MKITILDSIHCQADKGATAVIRPLLAYKGTFRKPSQYGVQIETYDAYLIQKNGLFLSGHLPRIISKFPDIKIEGEFEKNKPTLPPNLKGITPRSDQSRLIQQAIDQQRGVLLSPTGSGKTIVALLLLSCFPKSKVLFLCHSLSIIDQTFSELNKFGFSDEEIPGFIRKISLEMGFYLFEQPEKELKTDRTNPSTRNKESGTNTQQNKKTEDINIPNSKAADKSL